MGGQPGLGWSASCYPGCLQDMKRVLNAQQPGLEVGWSFQMASLGHDAQWMGLSPVMLWWEWSLRSSKSLLRETVSQGSSGFEEPAGQFYDH